MFDKWKQYETTWGTKRWPDRTQVAFVALALFGVVAIRVMFNITDGEWGAFIFGAFVASGLMIWANRNG